MSKRFGKTSVPRPKVSCRGTGVMLTAEADVSGAKSNDAANNRMLTVVCCDCFMELSFLNVFKIIAPSKSAEILEAQRNKVRDYLR